MKKTEKNVEKPKVVKKRILPSKDLDLGVVATLASLKWNEIEWLVLLWITKGEFAEAVFQYNETLKTRKNSGTTKREVVKSMELLNAEIDDSLMYVKGYILEKFKKLVITNNLQGIVIPSMRTPKNIVSFAKEFLGNKNLVIEKIDKKAYLSALGLAKYISVTCDSTSMISEAALTGKPLYIADIPTKKNDYRFKKFRDLFNRLNITKNLNEKLETWHYESLNETIRIAEEIKKKIN